MLRKIFLAIILLVLTGTLSAQNDLIRELIKNSGESKTDNLVILFDSTRTDVMETGLSYVRTHTLTKIIDVKGASEMNVVKFGYDPLSAYVDIERITIYKNDGSKYDLDTSRVLDYPAPARAIYWGAREKMIELGRLEPGDAVEVFQFRKGFTYALLAGQEEDDSRYIPPMKGHFYDIVEFFSSTYPVRKKVYQVTVPSDKPMQYEVYNGEVNSSVIFRGDKTIYTFTKNDILPFKPESRMVALSDVAPKLLISTSPDWYAKSKWFYKVNEDFGSFETTPEITAKVNEILRDAKTEMDSVSLLTHWVADEIRYSGISMGCGEGYTLHKGEMTFSDRCGVCKDKAGMLITMLRAAGFVSYPAMTMAGSRIDYIPADQFNHSVTIVKLKDGKYHLLDPTWVPFVRELWSSAEQQQQYLMGLPEGADLATTPISPASNHYLKISGKSKLDKDGNLEGTITVTAEGQTDAGIRGLFRNSNKTQWDQLLEKEMLKIAPNAKVNKVTYSDPIDYKKGPITITFDYSIKDYAIVSGGNMVFTPVVASHFFRNFQGHLAYETAQKDRKYAFRDRCSRQVELSETIELPGIKTIHSMPPSRKSGGEACSYDGGYTLSGNTLTMKQNVVLGKRIYDAADWPQFREAVSSQNAFAEKPVIFSVQ